MKTNRSRWMWVRFALTALLAFIVIAGVLPNLGRVIVDRSTTPATFLVVDRTRQTLIWIGIATVPLLLIVVGALWVALLEFIGWVLLIVLVVMGFMG